MEISYNDAVSSGVPQWQSESPTRTIDSASDSIDTIVDCTLGRNPDEIHTRSADINCGNIDNNLINCEPLQQMDNSHQLDAHIYSSPVYDKKPPLRLTAATIIAEAIGSGIEATDAEKPRLITHEEFQQDQPHTGNKSESFESYKKQRIPPHVIKFNNGDAGSTSHPITRPVKNSIECCSAFPIQIVLGTIQLCLAIALVAIGSLLVVNDMSLTAAGCGICTGLVAAITGSLGVVSIRKTQTAFLALSLICIAISTLALTISTVGLSRDINHNADKFDFLDANREVSITSSLVFILFLHFMVSIISVYRFALQLCSANPNNRKYDGIGHPNMQPMNKKNVQQYVKALSGTHKEKKNLEKLSTMWIPAAEMDIPPLQTNKLSRQSQPIILFPARTNSATMNAVHPSGIMLPPSTILPPPYPRCISYLHPVSTVYAPYPTIYKKQRNAYSVTSRQHCRSRKLDPNHRQRRKSEADIADETFEYKGLDRAIANSFLAIQEQTNGGSHLDYTSMSSDSDTYGRQATCSRTSSKTKIICRDVLM